MYGKWHYFFAKLIKELVEIYLCPSPTPLPTVCHHGLQRDSLASFN